MNATDILVEALMKSKLIHIEVIPTPCDDEIDWEATKAEKRAMKKPNIMSGLGVILKSEWNSLGTVAMSI